MNEYQKRKNRARQLAIEWQHDFNNHNYSYGELISFQDYFYKLARRYGLIAEFKENAIL